MLNQWDKRTPSAPPPSVQPPLSDVDLWPNLDAVKGFGQIAPLNLGMVDLVSGFDGGLETYLYKLPSPWFIYFFMGFGVLLCCITCIGHIAAEAYSGCCLCFYTLLKTLLILLEVALAAFIAFDHHWEWDLPYDPTGELDSLRSFIEANFDICKWVFISVVVIQASSLLLALILRAVVSNGRLDYDSEDEYDVSRGRKREPLLNPQLGQSSGSTKGDVKGTHSDMWSSRMREKYGLNSVEVK